MSKFLKDLKVGDSVTIATFNMNNPMNILGCEHIVDSMNDENVTFKNVKDETKLVALSQLVDGKDSIYDCLLDKWHYTGKPVGQYTGIFTNKEVLISELQSVVKSNEERNKK